jgi:hypothetical protein
VGRLSALLAVCAALAGCGGGTPSQTVSPGVLAAAVRATQATGSYTFSLGGTVDVAGQGFPIQGGGAVDARHGRARFRLDLRQALAASGIGSISPAEAVADAVVVGGVLYARSPYLARRRRVRSTWIRYPHRDVSPARLLGYLRAVGVVKRVGTDTVDGARTTHYSTEVDLRRYAQTARPDEVDNLNAAMRLVGDSLPVDVWVDASDRIRRIQAQVATASFQALPQLDIGGFGRPVAIRRP